MAYKEKKLTGKNDIQALYNAIGQPDKKPAVKKQTAKKQSTTAKKK